jgi:hypothetical protein
MRQQILRPSLSIVAVNPRISGGILTRPQCHHAPRRKEQPSMLIRLMELRAFFYHQISRDSNVELRFGLECGMFVVFLNKAEGSCFQEILVAGDIESLIWRSQMGLNNPSPMLLQ